MMTPVQMLAAAAARRAFRRAFLARLRALLRFTVAVAACLELEFVVGRARFVLQVWSEIIVVLGQLTRYRFSLASDLDESRTNPEGVSIHTRATGVTIRATATATS
jgi:hypothetical protein